MAFAQRVLAYDEPAVRVYGEIMGACEELGHLLSIPDGQIAAIAWPNHLTVATRNIADFEHCGVYVLAPFGAAA